jgi:NAD dependent epimerase/dehydratase
LKAVTGWSKKRALVTGAGGFIGSHLVERLVNLGANVRALVHYNALGSWGWLDAIPVRANIDVILGDLQDRDSVRNAMVGCDTVFHLGALIAIPYSYQAPASYIRTNIEGTFNVLQSARELNTAKIVHTSTSEVYGSALYVPIDEKHPLQGQSPYSASKIGADKMAESFYKSFGVQVVTVRPFNTFGPRQSARAVIPTIICQLLVGEEVKLGSLSPTRDMNYVDNTVDAFVKAAETQEAVGQTIHFGSNREISVGDLAYLIAKLMNKPISIVTCEDRYRPEKSEVERLIATNELANSLLKWTPEVSLEDGLIKTIAWFREHHGNYRPSIYNV